MIMKFFRGDDHQEKFRFKDFTTYRNITNISADGTSKLKIRYKKEVI